MHSLDLSGFEAQIRSRVELQGAPRWDPRVLITALVYGYATGVGAGRALERMMAWEPALRWLTANQPINYHTLTSFRTAHEDELKGLFAQFLVTLEGEGLVDFKTGMQDGTKVRARASRSSFHRAGSIQKRLEEARQYVEELVADTGYRSRENIEKMDQRGTEFLAPDIKDSHQGKGNLTRTGVSQEFHPASFVPIDDGDALRCPAGKLLDFKGERKHHQLLCKFYEAHAEDCGGCACKPQCCPKRQYRVIEKPIESAATQAFKERMATEQARAVYRRRSQICEFPNMYIKERAGVRRFHVSGLRKVQMEALWVALTFNIVRRLALRKR